MSIDYEDERFDAVKTAEKEALSEVEKTYGSMIGGASEIYKEQADAVKDYTQQQQQFQQEQTDFAIEQLQQQKDQAKKDYIKEQSAAFTDWKKQSSQHGANAEQMAGIGMTGTGYSESSQVAMYNAYQSRVAAARESFSQAVLTYDNAMKEARMQGSAAMAQIAFDGFQQQMELTLQGFQYENQLLQQQLAQKQQVQNTHYGRWQDILAQLNNEAALAEQQRQFNENMALQQKEYEEGVRQFNEELAEQQRQFNEQMALKTASTDKVVNKTEDPGKKDNEIENPDKPVDPELPVNPLKDVPPGNEYDTAGLGNDKAYIKDGRVGIPANQTKDFGKTQAIIAVDESELSGKGNNQFADGTPNYIDKYGKLSETEDTADVQVTQNGKKVFVEMPVRRAENGTLWVWDPTKKQYVRIKSTGWNR